MKEAPEVRRLCHSCNKEKDRSGFHKKEWKLTIPVRTCIACRECAAGPAKRPRLTPPTQTPTPTLAADREPVRDVPATSDMEDGEIR